MLAVSITPAQWQLNTRGLHALHHHFGCVYLQINIDHLRPNSVQIIIPKVYRSCLASSYIEFYRAHPDGVIWKKTDNWRQIYEETSLIYYT